MKYFDFKQRQREKKENDINILSPKKKKMKMKMFMHKKPFVVLNQTHIFLFLFYSLIKWLKNYYQLALWIVIVLRTTIENELIFIA